MNTAHDSLKDFFKFLLYIPYFFFWWYITRTVFLVKFIWRTVLLVIDALSLGPMLRYLFAPYHQDDTFVGRLMGFVVRFLWSFIGLAITIFVLTLLLLALPLHFILPFGFYFGIIGSYYFDCFLYQAIAVAFGWLSTLSPVLMYILYFSQMD